VNRGGNFNVLHQEKVRTLWKTVSIMGILTERRGDNRIGGKSRSTTPGGEIPVKRKGFTSKTPQGGGGGKP